MRAKKNTPSLSTILPVYEEKISGLKKYLTPDAEKLLIKEIIDSSSWNIRNLKRAKETIKHIERKRNSVLIGIKNINELITEISRSPRNFLILLSYCSKPIDCPSKRFSDKCWPRASSNICDNCPFKDIKLKADKIGCEIYIVYKTKKMIQKYLIPAFRKFKKAERQKPVIVTICPLALNKFLEIGVISGFKGIIYQFTEGICRTSEHFDRADEGEKREVTNLHQRNWQEINHILDEVIKKINP